jgi:hypothetical protein
MLGQTLFVIRYGFWIISLRVVIWNEIKLSYIVVYNKKSIIFVLNKSDKIMSKHNNNLSSSSSRKCYCGRKMTLGEEKSGIGTFGYTCPDCQYRKYSKPLTSEEYYKQFNLT